MFMNIAVQYIRPKLAIYAKDTLQTIIRELIADEELNLEVNPVTVSYHLLDTMSVLIRL